MRDSVRGQMTKQSRSRYILCSPWDKPSELDVYNWQDNGPFIKYWIRVFQEFEEASSLSGLTFYLVWNHILVPDLPSYGDDVVVVIASDEECVVPPYVNKVRFVFKTVGFYPWCGDTLREQSAASMMKCARDWTRWARHYALFLRKNGFSPKQGRKMVMPMGYARQTDTPGKPFDTRRYFVGFLGSIENRAHPRFSPKRVVGTPKHIARSRMVDSLQRLVAAAPDSAYFSETRSFRESTAMGAGERYSEIMADTKICLAPRGSSVETYRFFEGMRQGCVVICNRLPPHWFYEGCPAIQIDDWGNLEAEIDSLRADPQRLLDLHRKTVDWWRTKLSEPAIGGLIARSLESSDAAEEAIARLQTPEHSPLRPHAMTRDDGLGA